MEIYNRTLYKRAKSKFLVWNIKLQIDLKGVRLIFTYGYFREGQTIAFRKIYPKNIGKSNETTKEEQGILEFESFLRDKKKEGYKDIEPRLAERGIVVVSVEILNELLPIIDTDANDNFKPMKCKNYYKTTSKVFTDINFKQWKEEKYYYLLNPYVKKKLRLITLASNEIAIQPKLNGVRVFVTKYGKLLSKIGNTYELPHISNTIKNHIYEFIETLNLPENIYLDGEIYQHNSTLQDIVSATKKQSLFSAQLKFVIFDIAIPNYTQLERLKILKLIKEFINSTLFITSVEVIDTKILKVAKYHSSIDLKIQEYTDSFIKAGYEGSIIRDLKGLYDYGIRSNSIVKLKRLISKEFQIIDIVSQEVDRTLGIFICRTVKGKIFKVTPTGTIEYKKELLINKDNYINKLLSCDFYEYTPDEKPFHVVNNIIRDYE